MRLIRAVGNAAALVLSISGSIAALPGPWSVPQGMNRKHLDTEAKVLEQTF